MMQEGEEVMLKVKLRVRGPSPTQEKVRHSETVNYDQTGAHYLCRSLRGASVASLFQLFFFIAGQVHDNKPLRCFHQNSRGPIPKQSVTQCTEEDE